MALRRFSDNPAATTPLVGDEIIPALQGGVDVQITVDDIIGSASGAVTSVNGATGAVTLALDDLDDVDAATPANGDVLTWNDSAGAWEPAAGGGGGGGSGDVVGPASSTDNRVALFDGTSGKLLKQAGKTFNESRIQSIIVACSDESTNLTTGTAKATFRMPYAFTLTEVRASLSTAQASGSIFTVDVNENGTTILSTKLTIDNTEKTRTTAATAPVISDASLADDAEITIDIDQVGTAGAKGLKVALIGYPT
jgi:hypothetical protein